MDRSKRQQRPRQLGWWKSENRGAYAKRVMSRWERKRLKELAEVTEDVCGCKE